MSKIQLISVLGIVLVILIASGYFLLRQFNLLQSDKGTFSQKEQAATRQRVYDPKNSIAKWVERDSKTVVWQIKATVKQPFVYKSGGLLQGSVIIQNDDNQVEIPCQLGYLNGTVMLGDYEGELGLSQVSWINVDQAQVQPRLTAGSPILIHVIWNNKDHKERLAELERILDPARDSYKNGHLSVSKQAVDLMLISTEVGVL